MFFRLFILFVLSTTILAERCVTPNNEVGNCLPLYTCLPLINAVSTQDSLSIDFVRLSNCGGSPINPLVCCGSSSNFTVPVEIIPKRNNKKSLLPDRTYCGYQHSDDYFQPDKNKSEINEFPWLALLLYKNKDEPRPKARCSGSLISARYILTAAHCIEEVKHFNLSVSGIRLGDYNIENYIDCVNTTGVEECNDPIKEFGIEKIIVHPQYVQDYSNKQHDIALIRLNETVTYTDYVRPICLPFPETKFAEVGDTLLMTGWGRQDHTKPLVEIKKKVQSKLMSDEECSNFKTYAKYLTKNHFCTMDVEENTEYSCNGDTGGPVIFSNNYQWYQEGVISFAAYGCGSVNPNVHTKVKNYLEWIQSNIEP